jgi:ABC-type Na+ transport system ATPase subunit NatA
VSASPWSRGRFSGCWAQTAPARQPFVETLEGLRPVQRGEVTVNGVDVARDPCRVLRMVGVQLALGSFQGDLLGLAAWAVAALLAAGRVFRWDT